MRMISEIIKMMEDIIFNGTLRFQFYREIHGWEYATYPQNLTWCFLSRSRAFCELSPVTCCFLAAAIVKPAGDVG